MSLLLAPNGHDAAAPACPLLRDERTKLRRGPRSEFDPMYRLAAFRKRDRAWIAEVADMYTACLVGSRAVALMGIRTHLGLISRQVGKQPFGSPDSRCVHRSV